MMKPKREIKSPRKKNILPISRQVTKVNKTTLISSVSAASLFQPQNGSIKVVVRVRPLNARESKDNSRRIIKVVDHNVLTFDPKETDEPFFFHGVQQKTRNFLGKAYKELQFAFTRVFDCDVGNVEIFESSTKPLINSLMDGINCAVFAYGATGAGKTYTMLGSPSNPGITYLTMEELFSTIEKLDDEREFELGITYLEVYNEMVKDLLVPGSILQLREDQKGGVIVAGIKYVKITSASDLYILLEKGNENRTQHPTDANAESSRSHAVFQVYIKMKMKLSGEVRFAKLSMIDLAGSERASATGCQGVRFAEGANINKSLLALGNCINSLAACQRHIPYRDSKLTRLLKDSLGGTCQTVMIANISPSSLAYEDTYNTLRYATRAKAIKTNVKRNVLSVDLKMENYVKLVEDLQRKNAILENKVRELKRFEQLDSKGIDENASLNVESIIEPMKTFYDRLNSFEIGHLKRQINDEVYIRLCGLCNDSPTKREISRKLENKMNRYETERCVLLSEKDTLRKEILDPIDRPELRSRVQTELEKIENNNAKKLHEEQLAIYKEQFQQEGESIVKLASLVRSCYTHLKTTKNLTTGLTSAYESLTAHVQSIKEKNKNENDAIKPDSGISSVNDAPASLEASSSHVTNSLSHTSSKPAVSKSSPPIERIPIGDVTFSVNIPKKTPAKPQVKPPLKAQKPRFCSDKILVEGYKPSPMKKVKMNTAALKMKENTPSRSTRGPKSGRAEIGKPISSKIVSLSSRSGI